MYYYSLYECPFSDIIIISDEKGLCALSLSGMKYFESKNALKAEKGESNVIKESIAWLDLYFAHKDPGFTPHLSMIGTPFQKEIWSLLLKIPYGRVTTYGDIAKEYAEKHGIKKMSAQAVGGAVGSNEIAIIIPCHRVVGSNNNLTGYGGGIDKKIALLETENIDTSLYLRPTKGRFK